MCGNSVCCIRIIYYLRDFFGLKNNINNNKIKSTTGTNNINKVLLFVLIIACLFNITNKLVHKSSLKQELESSAQYVKEQQLKNAMK